jgi:spore coat protein CotH
MRARVSGSLILVVLAGACGGSKNTTGAGGTGGQVGPADTCAPFKDDQGQVSVWDCGPTSDELFNVDKVAEVRLTFDPKDLAATVDDLKAHGHEPCRGGQTAGCEPMDTWLDILWARWVHCGPYTNHVPVTMEYVSPDGIGNSVLRDVGMRLRGTKSRYSNPVAGFKLDFQALKPEPVEGEKSRRFGNETKLSILSVEGDNSLMIQCAAYAIMRKYGDVPAPRCNHIKVFVNGEYYGLMQSVEEVDDSRFRKHFYKSSQDNGTLYSCSGGCGYDDSKADLEFYGDQFVEFTGTGVVPPGQYPKAYEPIHIGKDIPSGAPDGGVITPAVTKAAIETDLIPLLKCGDADTTPDDEAFKACIAEWIDVDEWLKVIAAESLMPTIESFVGAKRNFFLYFKPDPMAPHGGRFLVYSWDYDAAMVRAGCLPSSCDPFTSVATWYTGGGRPALVVRLTHVFKDRYCAAMNSFLHDAYKPEIIDGFRVALAPAMAALPVPLQPMRSTMTAELVPRDPLTNDLWQTATQRLRDYMTTHGAAAQNQVNAACAASPPPETPDGGAQ